MCSFPQCGKRFAIKGTLTAHSFCHTDERPYIGSYPECEKKFKTQNGPYSHKYVLSAERRFVCTYTKCGKKFKSRGCLSSHERIHLGEKLYECTSVVRNLLANNILLCTTASTRMNGHLRVRTKAAERNSNLRVILENTKKFTRVTHRKYAVFDDVERNQTRG